MIDRAEAIQRPRRRPIIEPKPKMKMQEINPPRFIKLWIRVWTLVLILYPFGLFDYTMIQESETSIMKTRTFLVTVMYHEKFLRSDTHIRVTEDSKEAGHALESRDSS